MTRRSKIILASLLLLLAACDWISPRASEVFSVKLETAGGALLDLSAARDNEASVFAFLAPDCPLSQNYTLTLRELADEFAPDGVRVYGVISGGWFDQAEVDEFVRTYALTFPILLDDDFVLADTFDAIVTPEVFTIDGSGRVLYRGAIDNWAGELGQHRTVITEHYLRDALGLIVSGERPEIRATQAIGCYLERL
jgi:peroxiredoxin